MSTGSICCHPDAIRCPSLWQRAVRKKRQQQQKNKRTPWPGSSASRLLFYGLKLSWGGSASRRQNASFLLAVNCGQAAIAPLTGGDILSPTTWDLRGRRDLRENTNRWAHFGPRICFLWRAECFKKLFKKLKQNSYDRKVTILFI